MQYTKIELTQEDASLFIEYQKRYASINTFIKLLESVDAFNIKSGSITIHFDNLGQIASVDKQQHYRI